MKTARKAAHLKAVRTSISMPPRIFEEASKRQHHNGYTSFSDYLQHLIRKDAGMIMS